MDRVFQVVLLGLSGAGVGASMWLGAREAKGISTRGWLQGLRHVGKNIGRALVVALVAEAVFKAPTLMWTWRLSVYAFGLALIDWGIIGDLTDFGRRDRRAGDR